MLDVRTALLREPDGPQERWTMPLWTFAERLAEYQDIERRIKDQPQDLFGYLTLRWGLDAARARLGWAEQVLAELGP